MGAGRLWLDQGVGSTQLGWVSDAADDQGSRPVEFVVSPGTRAWTAGCLALGGAVLAGTILLGLGEIVGFLNLQIFEAIFISKS